MNKPNDIIANPELHSTTPAVFASAWAAAKAARGQTVDLSKTGAPAHLIIDQTPLIRRIRDYAAAQGYRLA